MKQVLLRLQNAVLSFPHAVLSFNPQGFDLLTRHHHHNRIRTNKYIDDSIDALVYVIT
jgi:hypothetical protein